MLFVGSSRGGGRQLAKHLMKEENDHVELFELRGFAGDTLDEAFRESYAISRGTKCQKYLFSLSLNPPQNESVPVEAFEDAIERVEKKLGLVGQPRAIIFHEKDGRRHAHCVWSRIDSAEMKAIEVPYFKNRLMDISRALYIEHDWDMPAGMIDRTQRSPLNYTLADYQQAKRVGHDARDLKALFQQCWAARDARGAFAAALKESGFYLSQGDRRGHVAVDTKGEVFAIARLIGKRTKDVRAKLGEHQDLPSMEETRAQIASDMTTVLRSYIQEAERIRQKGKARFAFEKSKIIHRQKQDRHRLEEQQKARWLQETVLRREKFATGLRGLWHRVTGTHGRIKWENEAEAQRCLTRDRAEKQRLIDGHLQERQALQRFDQQRTHHHTKLLTELHRDATSYKEVAPNEPSTQRKCNAEKSIRDDQQHIRGPTMDHERVWVWYGKSKSLI